jgi:hypothetical protein
MWPWLRLRSPWFSPLDTQEPEEDGLLAMQFRLLRSRGSKSQTPPPSTPTPSSASPFGRFQTVTLLAVGLFALVVAGSAVGPPLSGDGGTQDPPAMATPPPMSTPMPEPTASAPGTTPEYEDCVRALEDLGSGAGRDPTVCDGLRGPGSAPARRAYRTCRIRQLGEVERCILEALGR